uniref:Uncharacterized protein n=1 Tax=Anguilla anguilla TaxID=7936 RepID=A0A0E9VBX2_ANGAN
MFSGKIQTGGFFIF